MIDKFSKMIQDKRTEKKMSLSELSKLTGISSPSISGYERGTKSPSLENAVKIAQTLDISIDNAFDIKSQNDNQPITNQTIIKTMFFLLSNCKCEIKDCNYSNHYLYVKYSKDGDFSKMLSELDIIIKLKEQKTATPEMIELLLANVIDKYKNCTLIDSMYDDDLPF